MKKNRDPSAFSIVTLYRYLLFLTFFTLGTTDIGVIPTVPDTYFASSVGKIVPNNVVSSLRNTRTLAVKDFSGASPVCAVDASKVSIFCWHTSATDVDDQDRSFTVSLPSSLSNVRTIFSITVAQDIWALLDNGDLVFWLNAGGFNSSFTGIPGGYYPPWFIGNVSRTSLDRNQIGFVRGPYLSFLVYPDHFSTRNRDICALLTDGEINCWTLPLGYNVSLASLRPLTNRYYDVTSLRIPHTDFCGPTVTDPDACVSNNGPFQSIRFMPFPLIGRYDSTIVNPSNTVVYTGSRRWYMICGSTASQILCYGVQNFNNQQNSNIYLSSSRPVPLGPLISSDSSLDAFAISTSVRCNPSTLSTLIGSTECLGYAVVAGIRRSTGLLVTERIEETSGGLLTVYRDVNSLGFGPVNVTDVIALNGGIICVLLRTNSSALACINVLSPLPSSPIIFGWPNTGTDTTLPTWLTPLSTPTGRNYLTITGSDSMVCALRGDTLTPDCYVSDGSNANDLSLIKGGNSYPVVPQVKFNLTSSTATIYALRIADTFCMQLEFDGTTGSFSQDFLRNNRVTQYAIRCYGDQHPAQVDTPADLLVPKTSTSASRFTWMTGGYDSFCILESGVSGYRCWGVPSSQYTLSTSDTYSKIAYANGFICAIKATGNKEGLCFGPSFTAGTNPSSSTAQTDVVAGDTFGCFADTSNGNLVCVGSGGDMLDLYTTLRSQHGSRCTADSTSNPRRITVTYRTTNLVAGGNFICATMNSNFRCYGRNDANQLSSSTSSFTSVYAGFRHACLIRSSDSTVRCWGHSSGATIPAAYTSTKFTSLVLMRNSTCGLTVDSEFVCWGSLATGTPMTFSIADPRDYGTSAATIAARTFSVGLAGGNDTRCGTGLTDRCATLGGAINAAVGMDARIFIFNTVTTGPVTIGPYGAGLQILPGTANATVQLDNGNRQALNAPSFITIRSDMVTISGIRFQYITGTATGSTFPRCREAFYLQGRYITFRNVTVTGVPCTDYLIRAEKSIVSNSDLAEDDLHFNTVNLTASSASTFIYLSNIGRSSFIGITASFTNNTADYATFLRAVAVRRLTLVSLQLSGFNGQAPIQSSVSASCRYSLSNRYTYPCDLPSSWYCGSIVSIDQSLIGTSNDGDTTIVEGWDWTVHSVDAVGGYGGLICVNNVQGNNSVSVTLTNSTVNDMTTGYHGGAVAVLTGTNSPGTAQSVNITLGPGLILNRIRSLWGSGGLVYSNASDSESVTLFNVIANTVSARDHGGAVRLVRPGATLLIQSSQFRNVSSTLGDGGVVSTDSASSVTLTNVLADSVSAVAGNGGFLASTYTGPVASSSASSGPFSLLLNGITVRNATAAVGGGIFVRLSESGSSSASVTSSGIITPIISSNVGSSISITGMSISDAVSYSDGGGIHISGTLTSGITAFTIQDSSFLRCTAPIGGGGGIYYNFPFSNTLLISTNVQRTNFTSCSATTGGAVYTAFSDQSSSLPSITLTNLTADSNVADGNGGAFYFSSVRVNLLRSQLRTNRAGSGGAIYLRSSVMNIARSLLFRNNATVSNGGAIAALSCALSGITTSWLPDTPTSPRLAVWNDTSAWFPSSFIGDDIGTLFSSNVANGEGGAVWLRSCTGSFNYSSFVGNKATLSGGALAVSFASSSSPLYLGAAVFVGNSATGTDGGGAILLRSTAVPVTVGNRPVRTVSFAQHTIWLVRTLAYAALGRANNTTYYPADWLSRRLVFNDFATNAPPAVITTATASMITFGIVNVSVAFVGNTATNGKGGDIRILQANGFSSSLTLSNVVSLSSSSLKGGGSIDTANIDAVSLTEVIFNGTRTGNPDGSTIGYGGALSISLVPTVNLRNVTVTRSLANGGGGMFLSRVVTNYDPLVVLSSPTADSFSMSNVIFDNNTAYANGGDIFLDLGTFPTCTSCSFVRSTAGISGNSLATTARGVRTLPSVYDRSVPSGTGVNVTAAVIVGNSPVSSTFVTVQVIDGFGGDINTENGVVCNILSYNNQTNTLLPQAFKSIYGPGTSGKVNIFPYRVGVGPGTFGRMVASCTTAEGRGLGDAPKLFYTEGVQIVWSDATIAAPLYVLTSTKANIIPPERNLDVQVIDGLNAPMNVSISCTLTIDSAKDKNNADISIVTLTPMTKNTVVGVASFNVAFQTDSGATIILSASCLWEGDVITVKRTVTVYTVAVDAMWGPYGPFINCNIQSGFGCVTSTGYNTTGFTYANSLYYSPLIDGNTTYWNTFVNYNLINETAHTRTIEALPSSSDPVQIRLLTPTPKVSILQNRIGAGGYALATTGSIPCSISVDAIWARTENTNANRTVYVTDAVTTGTSTVTTVNGTAVFDNLGLRSVGFGALVPLLTQCSWPTGETLLTSRLIVTTKSLTLSFTRQPPAVVLPSGLDSSNYYIMDPIIVQAYELGSSTLRPEGLKPVTGISMGCGVRLVTVSSGGSEVPNLVGTSENVTDASTGRVTFTNIGIYAAPNSQMRLTVSCTWVSGAIVSATSSTILISPLAVPLLLQPLSFLAASGPVASLKVPMNPFPILQLQGYDATAFAANVTKFTNITGKIVPCTVGVNTIDTPAGSALPQAVGTLTVNSDINGQVILNDVGINGALGAVVQLVVKCTWVSGSVITATSTNITLSPLRVVFSTAPPSTILPSGATQSSLVTMTPAPAVKLQAYDAATQTYGDVVGRSVPCSVGAELLDTSLDAAVQVVGTTDYSTNSTTGIAVLDKIGIFGPIGAAVHLVARCTWVSGSVIEGISPSFLMAPISVAFVTQPSSTILASGTGSVTGTAFPFVPAPTVQLRSFDNSTKLFSNITSSVRIQCAVSTELVDTVGSAQFVGTTDYSTSVVTGLATLTDVGVSGPLSAGARLIVRCTWASGSVVTGYSSTFQLAPLRIHWLTQPSLSIASSGSSANQVLVFSPSPVFRTQFFDNGTKTWNDITTQRLPCVIGAELLNYTGTDLSATVAGTTDYFTDPANTGRAVLNRIGIIAPVGMSVRLTVRCTWVSGAFITGFSNAFDIAQVRIHWIQQPGLDIVASGNAASQLYIMNPAPIIQIQYYDNSTLNWINVVDQRMLCTVGTALVNYTGVDETASITGQTDYYTDTTDNGRATLNRIGIVAPIGYLATLTVRCTWISGAQVTSVSDNFRIADMRINWVIDPPATIVPSGSTASQLVVISPAPTIILQAYDRGSSTWNDITDKRVQCSVGVDFLENTNPDITATLVGTGTYYTDTAAGGEGTLSRIGIVAPVGSRVVLTTRCTWVSGATITGTSVPILIADLRVDWVEQPPLHILTSGTIASQLVTMEPAPILRIQSYNNFTGNFTDIDSYRVPCRISAESVHGSSYDTSIQVVGTSDYFINASIGTASINRLGIAGTLGAEVNLIATCTWVSGAIVTSRSRSILLSPLSIQFTVQPPSFVRASATAADTWTFLSNPTPVITVSYVSLNSTGSSNTHNISTLLPLTGYTIPCSFFTDIITANGGSTPQLIGVADYSLEPENGTITLSSIGFTGVFSAQVRILARCTWISGTIITNYSTPVTLSPVTIALVQSLPIRIRGSSTDSSSWNYIYPPPSIVTQYQTTSTGTLANLTDISIPCVATVYNVTNTFGRMVSLSTVQIIGVPDITTDTNGTATWTQLGVSAPMGYRVSLLFRCTYVNGAIISVPAPFTEVVAASIKFTQFPPSVVIPGTASSSGLIVLNPPPKVLVYSDTTGTEIPHTASSIRCALSLVSVAVPVTNVFISIGGDTIVNTNSSTGVATFSNVGITGPFNSVVLIRATCTWVSGEDISILSSNITILRIHLNMTVPTPTIVVPSSPTQLTPWSPSPVIQLMIDSNFDNLLEPLPLSISSTTILTCTVSIFASRVTGTGQVSLQGDTTALTDTNGAVTFATLGASGPFDSAFELLFQCPWVTGQAINLVTPTVSFPTPRISWNIRPEPYVLYNTEMSPFEVLVAYRIGNSPYSNDWSAIGIPLSEIRCTLDSVLSGTSQPVIVSGTSISSITSNGIARFSAISLVPPPSNNISATIFVDMRVSCQLAGLSSGAALIGTVIIQTLTSYFVVPPPARALPSSQSAIIPFTPAIEIGVLNHTGGLLIEDGVVCTVAVQSAIYPPGLPMAEQRSLLLGTTRGTTMNGIATLSDLSLNAPFGTIVTLAASCSRQQGGTILIGLSTIRMDVLKVKWFISPPSVVLQNTPTTLVSIVRRYAPNITDNYEPMQGTDTVVEGVPCSLNVVPFVTNPASNEMVYLGGMENDFTSRSNATGVSMFRLSLQGKPGAFANVSVVCSLAGQLVPSTPAVIEIDTVEPYFTLSPPSVWLPTSGLQRTPINPPPQILLRRRSNGEPVDARSTICRVDADSSASILEKPVEGYKMILPVEITDAADTEYNATIMVMTTPIELTDVLLSGDFGLRFNLIISCVRGQGDETAKLYHSMRLYMAQVRWREYLPSDTVSQQSFFTSMELFDADADPALAIQNLTIPGSNLTVKGDTIILDKVTMCSMTVISNDTSVIIQNADGTAENGIVSIRGASLTARSGTIVEGIVTCSLGEMQYSNQLAWAILMQPCQRGFAPAGDGGYTCAVCGNGFYSDGGPAARCIKCPLQGVVCAGGILNFLPAFYRTPDGRPVVDDLTEFRPCSNQDACIVNTDTTNRTGDATHSCADGYVGPLCAVCDQENDYSKLGNSCRKCWPSAANWLITSFFPILFLIFAYYISVIRKQAKGSRAQIIFRTLVTYFQTLGTVGSVYLAKGTAKFREYFGFSDIVGDSVLSASPIQCSLRLGFPSKFSLTIGMPFIIAILAIIINILVIIHRRYKKVGFTGLMEETKSRSGSGTGGGATRSSTSIVSGKGSTTSSSTAVHQHQHHAHPENLTVKEQVHMFFTQRKWIAPVIFVMNLGYSSITTTAFSALNCLPFTIGGNSYMSQDLNIQCYTPLHNILRLIAGIVITLFGFGFPLMFATILRRSEKSLLTEETFQKYGFLYDGYSLERKLYFWECIIMTRKALIVFIGSILHDPYYQVVASVTLMTVALTLQAMYSPFRSRSFNAMESTAIVTIIFTQLISIFYLRYDSIAKPCLGADGATIVDNIGTTCYEVLSKKELSDDLTTAVLVLLNGSFIVMMITLLFKAILKKIYRESKFLQSKLGHYEFIRKWCDLSEKRKRVAGMDKILLSSIEGKLRGIEGNYLNGTHPLVTGVPPTSSGYISPRAAAQAAVGGLSLDPDNTLIAEDEYTKDNIPKSKSMLRGRSTMGVLLPSAKAALAAARLAAVKRQQQQNRRSKDVTGDMNDGFVLTNPLAFPSTTSTPVSHVLPVSSITTRTSVLGRGKSTMRNVLGIPTAQEDEQRKKLQQEHARTHQGGSMGSIFNRNGVTLKTNFAPVAHAPLFPVLTNGSLFTGSSKSTTNSTDDTAGVAARSPSNSATFVSMNPMRALAQSHSGKSRSGSRDLSVEPSVDDNRSNVGNSTNDDVSVSILDNYASPKEKKKKKAKKEKKEKKDKREKNIEYEEEGFSPTNAEKHHSFSTRFSTAPVPIASVSSNSVYESDTDAPTVLATDTLMNKPSSSSATTPNEYLPYDPYDPNPANTFLNQQEEYITIDENGNIVQGIDEVEEPVVFLTEDGIFVDADGNPLIDEYGNIIRQPMPEEVEE